MAYLVPYEQASFIIAIPFNVCLHARSRSQRKDFNTGFVRAGEAASAINATNRVLLDKRRSRIKR
jgi:hypothetical protein